ncbi:MAG TPA: hypothetical protein VG820_05915 [Fimbriimonadaceae bacterium]|nr:hypothetical protein [Fimbriimonadaceae bacterium]
MKSLLHPVPVACFLIAVAGAIFRNLPMAVLGLLCGGASMGLLSARKGLPGAASTADALGPEARSLLHPVEKLTGDIGRIRDENGSSQAVQVLGGETLQEANEFLSKAGQALMARERGKRLLRERDAVEKELSTARMRLEFASERERRSLEETIRARTADAERLAEIGRGMKAVEIGLSEAEAALAEVKARLAAMAVGERLADSPREGLRETIGRLRSIASTFPAAEEPSVGGEAAI